MLSDDRWMYPFETWLPTGATGPLDQKAAAIFSSDQGKTWGEMAVVADDPTGRYIHWDHSGTVLPPDARGRGRGRIYETMWVRDTEVNADLSIHFTLSQDDGRTWSLPRPTGLIGQASAPIALPDGRVAVLYTHRTEPEGVRLAIGYENFDEEIVIFDAGDEALLGDPDRSDALATNMAQGFGKMGGVLLKTGELMVTYWGTVNGVSHCRWATVQVD
jgi:GAF domain-containing protein